MRGIRRTLGGAKTKKAPAVAAKMLGTVAMVPAGLAGIRDRALLLLGFAGAFRRSEPAALDMADIAETESGLLASRPAKQIRKVRALPSRWLAEILRAL